MQGGKFIEHLSIEDSHQMLYTTECMSEDSIAMEDYKDDVLAYFVGLLKINNSTKEIVSIDADFAKEDKSIIRINLALISGKVSQTKVREAINKGQMLWTK
jgi:hypothetical protein